MKWREIVHLLEKLWSPSLGREWIEIDLQALLDKYGDESPSLGREWIEIDGAVINLYSLAVSLLGEGVD